MAVAIYVGQALLLWGVFCYLGIRFFNEEFEADIFMVIMLSLLFSLVWPCAMLGIGGYFLLKRIKPQHVRNQEKKNLEKKKRQNEAQELRALVNFCKRENIEYPGLEGALEALESSVYSQGYFGRVVRGAR